MRYFVTINNETTDLPDYTFSIADKIEEQERLNAGNGKFRDKCRGMYDLICSLVGKDKVESQIGKFPECDPNMVNIIYLDIIKAYNKPLNDYNIDENQTKFSEAFSAVDGEQMRKLTDLVNAMTSMEKIKVVK